MKKILILSSILFILNCYSQNDTLQVSNNSNLKHFDTIKKKSFVTTLKNCRFVTFTPDYSKEIHGLETEYFVPDSIAISCINENIAKEYCQARLLFMENFHQKLIKEHADAKNYIKEVKAEHRKHIRNHLKNCPKYVDRLNQHDKQLIGYVNDKGEKIILIQLIDFKEDPYNLKSEFTETWFQGSHGWFETNVRLLQYHQKTGQITIY